MATSIPPHTPPVLGVVVPCFNEEEILTQTAGTLKNEIDRLVSTGLISPQSKIYFIDDGSRDRTWLRISELVDQGGPFAGIKLTRNFGHQRALYAGLMEAHGDAILSLDADLQDDISVIEKMVEAFLNGSEVILGVRDDRDSDDFFKRWSALAHYWISALMGIETVRNHADFRLLSRRAVTLLGQYQETNLYLRGIVPLLGLKSKEIYFSRKERAAGDSKYGLRKMVSLSLKGITSFSIMPLRLISAIGLLMFCLSCLLGGWALYGVLFVDGVVAGWASTVIPIYLLGGLQLLAIGIAGEYIGKIYMEVKNRPLYFIDTIHDTKNLPEDKEI